jgi:hypothetical protein
VSFSAAVPLGLLLVEEGDAYAAAPSRRRGLVVAAFGVVLFFSHLLVLLVAAAVVAILILVRAPDARRGLLRLAPLLPSGAVTLGWIFAAATRDVRVQAWRWGFGWIRLTALSDYLFAAGPADATTTTLVDHGAATMAIALTVALTLSRPRASRDLVDWVPLAAAGAAFLVGPSIGFQGVFVSDRFAVFLVPFAFAALRCPTSATDRRIGRVVTVAAALGWSAVLSARFAAFDREMAPAERVLRCVEPGRRMTSLVFQPASDHVPNAWVFTHVAAWAQAERGGVLDTSYAHYVNLPIQYRPGREPPHTSGIEWKPEQFDWAIDGGADYFLVQGTREGEHPLARVPDPLVLVAREGDWQLFRRLRPGDQSASRL